MDISGLGEGIGVSLQKAEEKWDRDAIAKTHDKIRRYRTKKGQGQKTTYKGI